MKRAAGDKKEEVEDISKKIKENLSKESVEKRE
jgi:hypothetical protein